MNTGQAACVCCANHLLFHLSLLVGWWVNFLILLFLPPESGESLFEEEVRGGVSYITTHSSRLQEDTQTTAKSRGMYMVCTTS